MSQQRYLESEIINICFKAGKMAFISGPRQSGKTTIAKRLLKQYKEGSYFNWDDITFRKLWTKDPSLIIKEKSNHNCPLIVLDEIHKAKLWKRSLKGVYDTKGTEYNILVTGSARLNIYKKGSDSLLGRYYLFRLHPFSLNELIKKKHKITVENLIDSLFSKSLDPAKQSKDALEQLYQFGPFPEPLLAKSKQVLNLWQRNRIELIIREDIRDLSNLKELSQIEMLASILPERVANPLSIKSLSEDLEVAYTTVKRWLFYLQELYYCFEIKPYFKSLPRALKKEGKLYLWDFSEIENEGARFENLIALHLLKYCHYLTDTGAGVFDLHYLKNREKKEIDFLITKKNKPWLPIEVKLSQDTSSNNWAAFTKHLDCKHVIQVIKKSGVFKIIHYELYDLLIISADYFLLYLR